MKQLLRPALVCFSLALLFSCKKETNIAKGTATPEVKSVKKSPVKDEGGGGTTSKYPSDLSLVPLNNNGDGTWSGTFGGMQVRFSDFMYEIFYDANGNPLDPKPGDAVWPQTIGPEPGMTTNQQFACLRFITTPGQPENQVTAQNQCQFLGTYYSPGQGMTNYWNAVDANWTNYQNALTAYYISLAMSGYGIPPTVPSSPQITPYLLQDYQNAGSGTLISSARFAIYSYNHSTGIVFGYDLR